MLAAAVDTGESADLATAIKEMRACGWGPLADALAAAFATRIQAKTSGPASCGCAHADMFHTADLGCWLCDCTLVYS